MEQYTGQFMNTTFSLSVSDRVNPGWREKMDAWFQYVDKEWSRFRADNELDQLNQAPVGVRIELPPPLYDIIQTADQYHHSTGGRFSPYLKRAMEHQGYRRSFPFAHSEDDPEPFAFHFEEKPFLFLGQSTVEKHTSEELDLGGIAKGYAVQSAAEWLKRHGADEGMVDGGGDISLWTGGRKEWRIGIANPWEETRNIGVLCLKNKAVATSNRLYRSWKQGNRPKHHLLDGRSGQIVQTHVVQSTVIANRCTEAEVCAKMCFLLTDEEREAWFSECFPDVSYVLVTEDGRVTCHIKEGVRFEAE